ncbi:MAG: ABC transporter ATP-binding protein [Clostridia bacterium]|nr:ABC transporter ATP-binding protein [Clostridia bacterium]
MIEVLNIEKSYGNEKVLKGVSLKILDGEFVSIMGKSGSGKSTLLNILAGFLTADSGEVLWDGEEISSFSGDKMASLRSSKMGFVFQSFKLIPTLNVKDNLLLTATLGKKANAKTLAYVEELAERLGISDMLKKFPDELSGGQCQRCAIIRALAYKPSVIILDEPTGALDSVMESTVMDLLTEINKALETTVIQVTHSKRVAEYGSRIITLKDGEIQDEAVL